MKQSKGVKGVVVIVVVVIESVVGGGLCVDDET